MVIDVLLNPKIAVSRMGGGGKTVSQAPELVKNFEKKSNFTRADFFTDESSTFQDNKTNRQPPG